VSLVLYSVETGRQQRAEIYSQLISSKTENRRRAQFNITSNTGFKICALLPKVTQSLLQLYLSLSVSVSVPNRPKLEKEKITFVTFANIQNLRNP